MKIIISILITSLVWFIYTKIIKSEYHKRLLIESSKNIVLNNENSSYKSIVKDLITLPDDDVIKENLLIIQTFKD